MTRSSQWPAIALSVLLFGLLISPVGCHDADELDTDELTAVPEPEPMGPWKQMPKVPKHVDHSSFFTKPFKDGPSVTKACLECHKDAAKEVMKTAHWQWQGEEVVVPGHDKPMRIGKKNVINNFCIGITSNWQACTPCHIGYGWKDESFDFNKEANVDCLICHDTSGTYRKKPAGAGVPAEGVNLLAVARSVGRPTRANCGTCHFRGGGGNAIKHGDLDNSMLHPNERIDVHMGRYQFECVDCHRTEHHNIPGRSISVSVDDSNRVKCTDCHKGKPHKDARINAHLDRVACQTCHIPRMAVQEGTKVTWDWGEAGQDLPIKDKHVYMKIKGRFTFDKNFIPEYRWWNGTATRYILGDKIDPNKPTQIARPLGDRSDPKAKIWPFKIHRGKQPYDKEYLYMLPPHVYGPEGFWSIFDWDKALRLGAQANGIKYSGKYDFAPTEMAWPLSHMVAVKEKALTCTDCHGPSGRMNWKALGYDQDPILASNKKENRSDSKWHYYVPRNIEDTLDPQARKRWEALKYKLKPLPKRSKGFEHMPIQLKDSQGELVQNSGKPVSLKQTCSYCHNLENKAFEQAHAYHRNLQNLSPERAALLPYGPEPSPKVGESNCLLCHMQGANEKARRQSLIENPAWAIAATLWGTGVVEKTGQQWHWKNTDKGWVQLNLGPATAESCGHCHGLSSRDLKEPFMLPKDDQAQWASVHTGQVFSPQKINASGLNIKGKDALNRPWDLHAARLVQCTDCHYSKNLPSHWNDQKSYRPDKSYDGKGKRTCETCHNTNNLINHKWLPPHHFKALSCESCHIPHSYVPARAAEDRTVLNAKGEFVAYKRGIEKVHGHEIISGFEPVLLPRKSDGKLAPFNLISTWTWVYGEKNTPVPMETLRRAWFVNGREGAVHPSILNALDVNKDGQLDPSELKLDTPAKVKAVQRAIESQGLNKVHIQAKVEAHALHHGVATGSFARHTCESCHKTQDPVLDLGPNPNGIMPEWDPNAEVKSWQGELKQGDRGLIFQSHSLPKALNKP